MRILTAWKLAALLATMAAAGCFQEPPKKTVVPTYDIQGKVVAIRADKTGVTLDHEDIPGLMKGMQMEFPVSDAKVLEGLEPGDQVLGKLRVDSGKYLITELKKR
jgi:protein SCO1/2